MAMPTAEHQPPIRGRSTILAFLQRWERTSMVALFALTLLLVFTVVPLAQDWLERKRAVAAATSRVTPMGPQASAPSAPPTAMPDPIAVATSNPHVGRAQLREPSTVVATSQGVQSRRPVDTPSSRLRLARGVPEPSPSEKMALAFRHAQGPAVPLTGEELRLALVADARITKEANQRELSTPRM